MPEVKINDKVFKISEVYQSVYRQSAGKRPCEERLRTILTADLSFNYGNILKSTICDIGCNMGYFLLSLSEYNESKFMLGIDVDNNAINISKELASIYKRHNLGFKNIRYQDLQQQFNTYLCLSIFHHDMQSGMDFLNKISEHAQVIYIEQATHLEWAYFGKNLCTDRNPFHYWQDKLNTATGNKFNVRLIGVHKTHLNTIRPMYQLKRKIKKLIKINSITYEVYDEFNVPYISFGTPRRDKFDDIRYFPREKTYSFATHNNNHYFIKKEKNNYKVYNKLNGFLLNDIMRYGMLPFYDTVKLKEQLKDLIDFNHNDLTPWNLIVDEDSIMYPIDYDDNHGFIKKELMIDTLLNML